MYKIMLKPREERRLKRGHPWVFSNEVDVARTPISQLTPGELVEITSASGQLLGTAYVNPHTLICARILERGAGEGLSPAILDERIDRAAALRARLYPEPYYRLIFGESDELPGLVVDRYADVLVAQISTVGMECRREMLLASLTSRLEPRAIALRNDGPARGLESLPREIETVYGGFREPLRITENDAQFYVWPTDGQKTGWYFDQRENRARAARYACGARVLDAFSYTGAWGIMAALHGALEVTCIESSPTAIERLEENVRLNRVEGCVQGIRADAFEAMKAMFADGRRFDLVVLDPPAFIHRRKDRAAGGRAYRRLALLGMQLLVKGGVLVSASCSSHLSREELRDAIRRAGLRLGRPVQILEEGHQAPDHPIHPAMPETEYLKVFFARVG